MAVAQAAIARAPFTGILLVIETTGALPMVLPMIIAVFGATGAARLLGTPSMGHGLETELQPSHDSL